ncbi:hypothetical protein BH24CHL8_BH24CHL8_02940 [soil metagenome]
MIEAQQAQAMLLARGPQQLRRCTFRRLTAAAPARRGETASYQVECLYAGRDAPLALGDLVAARRVCDPCGNPGIFRADEDRGAYVNETACKPSSVPRSRLRGRSSIYGRRLPVASSGRPEGGATHPFRGVLSDTAEALLFGLAPGRACPFHPTQPA